MMSGDRPVAEDLAATRKRVFEQKKKKKPLIKDVYFSDFMSVCGIKMVIADRSP